MIPAERLERFRKLAEDARKGLEDGLRGPVVYKWARELVEAVVELVTEVVERNRGRADVEDGPQSKVEGRK